MRDPIQQLAETLWEEIGGNLCVCTLAEVPHWCESCQGRIQKVKEAICGELKSVSWIIRQWREAEARAMQAEEKADELTAHISLLQEMETYLQHKQDCELARDGLYKDGEPRQKSINHRWNQVTMKNEYDWRQCECTCGLAALLRREANRSSCEQCKGDSQ